MKFTYPAIDKTFSTEESGVNCIVIENKRLYAELIDDIYQQTQGMKGKSVLYNGKALDFPKYVDLLTSFFPFEINRKELVSKILISLEHNSQTPENYEATMSLLSAIEKYLNDISSDIPCDLIYNKLNIMSVLKASGVEIVDDSASLPERVLNYMELVREFEGNKLFITVNMRSFIDDSVAETFFESVIMHKYDLLMLENVAYPVLRNELRFTVDKDLCCF